eukprot:CAMPEP_0172517432 /NCGR_PEP_ID=MMETSP1066-20121228/284950_1 /TAXON_ID=671091 /ORGANISM="Coscinodiscus wailesii, Strain CCMP2513" /LENGTH=762 /DNA_ID=CAMNT_0013299429 /DNA_START=24 /DNA_END=2312 /DNA_ORIENTATION=-
MSEQTASSPPKPEAAPDTTNSDDDTNTPTKLYADSKDSTESPSAKLPPQSVFKATFPQTSDADSVHDLNEQMDISPAKKLSHPLHDMKENKSSAKSSNDSEDKEFQPSPAWQPFEIDAGPSTSRNTSLVNSDNLAATPSLGSFKPEIFQRLDREYERAIEDREILWNARYASVRQSAFFSLLFFAFYLIIGTMFYSKCTDWDLKDSLLFSIYTITTVGYGNHKHNETATEKFQVFTIFYIFVGIAALTSCVAQAYQCLALEANRAQHSRDAKLMLRRSKGLTEQNSGDGLMDFDEELVHRRRCCERMTECFTSSIKKIGNFLRLTCLGNTISVFFPLTFLVLLGALVVGPIEQWSFREAAYWAVVTLTTVGFGDYYPTKDASIWFCIFYLPFSVGFMSLFLASVARFYISMSGKNIKRLETSMRRKLRKKRQAEDKEVKQESTLTFTLSCPGRNMIADGSDHVLMGDENNDRRRVFGSISGRNDSGNDGASRREYILHNSIQESGDDHMCTMKDIIQQICVKDQEQSKGVDALILQKSSLFDDNDKQASTNSKTEDQSSKPSLELRVVVLERFANIIATDIAGYQNNVEIKENTLSVTIDIFTATAEKWMIPHRARKAFRNVAFESLLFVGEHSLITRGGDALFELSPMEFHGLFNPLLAAMGEKATMKSWIASTNILADVELKNLSYEDDARTALTSASRASEDMFESSGVSMKRSFITSTKKLVSAITPSAAVRTDPQCQADSLSGNLPGVPAIDAEDII